MRDLEAFGGLVSAAVQQAISPLREKQALQEEKILTLQGTVADLRSQLAEAKAAPAAVDTKVYERLAVAESKASRVDEAEKRLSEISDRLLTWETKASVTPPAETDVRDHLVALSPAMERIAAVEEQVKGLSDRVTRLDVTERVVTLEAKSAQPVQEPDADTRERVQALSDVPQRLAAIEAQLPLVAEVRKDLAGVNERIVVVETKQAAPVASVAPDTELRDRLVKVGLAADRLDAELAKLDQRVSAVDTKHVDAVAVVTKDVSKMSERVAVAEVRAFTPGPAGASGRDGVDGVDGVSYDEMTATLEHDRTIVLRAAKGERVKEIGSLKVPFMINRGTWTVGKEYERGDVVTWSGGSWHCDAAASTAKPGDGPDWRLIVKRGNDGRDLRPDDTNPASLPVVRTR